MLKKKNRIEANIFVVANLKPCKNFWPGQVLELCPDVLSVICFKCKQTAILCTCCLL